MLIDTIQKIIKAELAKVRLSEPGIVTSIFPHCAEDDKDNYEVNVRLKNSALELRHVPVAVSHIGTAQIPDVGEMVIVSFINGNLNQPVITGRLYNEEKRPPLSVEKEYIIEHPYGETTRIKIDKDKNVILESGATRLQLGVDSGIDIQSEDYLKISIKGDVNLSVDGKISVETKGDVSVKADGNVAIECADAKIKASGNIDLGESGGGIVTDMTHKCYLTGAPPVGSGTVKAKS